ncbi:MAG TPA: alpha/beta fold hydrolase, partial [Chromatiaceae bacterium]|nr:alpha/beta fold hydrolase [Chromatiaceae bacterium]
MKSTISNSHSKRFYRNLTLYILMWLGLFLLLWGLTWASVPFYVYLLLAYPLLLVVLSFVYAFHRAHPRRERSKRHWSPADIGAEYEEVQFPSRDGLTLSGWFIPGERRETIILAHGFGSSGMSMIYPASGLLLYGYSVLLFDFRAHGRSEGDTCSMGWREDQDLLGAIDYVQSRDDVDGDKIGALGVSLGGKVVLRAAVQSEAIKAVVAEGPGAVTLAEGYDGRVPLWRRLFVYPIEWCTFTLFAFMTGDKPPPGLTTEISTIAPRPILLISTGQGKERGYVHRLYEAAQEPKTLWEIPQARHSGGYFANP